MVSLVRQLLHLPPHLRDELLDQLTEVEVEAALREIDYHLNPASAPRWDELHLEPHQRAPAGDWTTWLVAGGRGTGKTSAASAYVYEHVMHGPPCIPGVPGGHRIGLVAPTLGDASRSVNAPGGLKSLDPRVREVTRKGGTYVEFPDPDHPSRPGATLSEFGAHTKDDVERLRAGGNLCLLWCEEVVAWRQYGYENDAWDLAHTGRRLGPLPRTVVTSTPKPIRRFRELHEQCEDPATPARVMTHGTMYDNPHLAPSFIAEMEDQYSGTRLEAQELLGRLLGDVEGALWSEALLDGTRYTLDRVPPIILAVVGVDPAFSEETTADEAGIIVAGIGAGPTGAVHGFTLDDRSIRGGFVWPRVAVDAYHEHNARAMVIEANLGGRDYLRRVVHAIDSTVTIETVHAREGKRTRAEPFAMLYDQDRWHHAGTFPMLEAEQTTWVPGEKSPNRLDALVWAGTYLASRITLPTGGAASAARRGRRTVSKATARGR